LFSHYDDNAVADTYVRGLFVNERFKRSLLQETDGHHGGAQASARETLLHIQKCGAAYAGGLYKGLRTAKPPLPPWVTELVKTGGGGGGAAAQGTTHAYFDRSFY
jgi:hypothetical protein